MATGTRVSATPIGHGSPVDGMVYTLAKWTAVQTKAINPTHADRVSDVTAAPASPRAQKAARTSRRQSSAAARRTGAGGR